MITLNKQWKQEKADRERERVMGEKEITPLK